MCNVLTYLQDRDSGKVYFGDSSNDHSHGKLYQQVAQEKTMAFGISMDEFKPAPRLVSGHAMVYLYGTQRGRDFLGRMLKKMEDQGLHITEDGIKAECDLVNHAITLRLTGRSHNFISAELRLDSLAIVDYVNLFNAKDTRNLYQLEGGIHLDRFHSALEKRFPTLEHLCDWFHNNFDPKTYIALKSLLRREAIDADLLWRSKQIQDADERYTLDLIARHPDLSPIDFPRFYDDILYCFRNDARARVLVWQGYAPNDKIRWDAIGIRKPVEDFPVVGARLQTPTLTVPAPKLPQFNHKPAPQIAVDPALAKKAKTFEQKAWDFIKKICGK